MSAADATREELAKVASLIGTAERLLAGGRLVELSAVEARVRDVCARVERMERDDGARLRDSIEGLIAMLGRLDGEVRRRLHLLPADAGTEGKDLRR